MLIKFKLERFLYKITLKQSIENFKQNMIAEVNKEIQMLEEMKRQQIKQQEEEQKQKEEEERRIKQEALDRQKAIEDKIREQKEKELQAIENKKE